MEKIVVTGMGSICALGLNLNEIWGNVKNGISGLGPITQFDTTDSRVKIACEIKDFDRYLVFTAQSDGCRIHHTETAVENFAVRYCLELCRSRVFNRIAVIDAGHQSGNGGGLEQFVAAGRALAAGQDKRQQARGRSRHGDTSAAGISPIGGRQCGDGFVWLC